MHQLNVLVIGPKSFVHTLNELKPYLKFNFSLDNSSLNNVSINEFDIIFFHRKALDEQYIKDVISKANIIKIMATDNITEAHMYDEILKLPTKIDEINLIIERSVAKKVFNLNSSIKIKKYLLDKNEKKLFKNELFIILTEKEIQLLEIFLDKKKPISKNEILSLVWHYSTDADTHTVETHIYRLRKKINEKFSDEEFILNDKKGYYL